MYFHSQGSFFILSELSFLCETLGVSASRLSSPPLRHLVSLRKLAWAFRLLKPPVKNGPTSAWWPWLQAFLLLPTQTCTANFQNFPKSPKTYLLFLFHFSNFWTNLGFFFFKSAYNELLKTHNQLIPEAQKCPKNMMIFVDHNKETISDWGRGSKGEKGVWGTQSERGRQHSCACVFIYVRVWGNSITAPLASCELHLQQRSASVLGHSPTTCTNRNTQTAERGKKNKPSSSNDDKQLPFVVTFHSISSKVEKITQFSHYKSKPGRIQALK